MQQQSVIFARGLAGAILGGVVGYFAFQFAFQSGFYALALPGALLGLGCGYASRVHSTALGIICSIAALGLGVFCEWKTSPFIADESLSFFLKNVHQLTGVTLIMIVLGGIFGFWFGRGRPGAQPIEMSSAS
ncbi:MAG: hypothetical protein AAF497_01950 [Planctomycetota bacterium]